MPKNEMQNYCWMNFMLEGYKIKDRKDKTIC